MKMAGRIVYSINVQDLQNVAHQKLSRRLTKSEIQAVEHKLGDFIDWYGAIETAIHWGLRASKPGGTLGLLETVPDAREKRR